MGVVVDKMKSFATVLMSALIFLLFLYSVSGKHFLVETKEKLKTKDHRNNTNIRPKTGMDYQFGDHEVCFVGDKFEGVDEESFKYLTKHNLVKFALDKIKKLVGKSSGGDYARDFCINKNEWRNFMENLEEMKDLIEESSSEEEILDRVSTTPSPSPPTPSPSGHPGAIIVGGDRSANRVEIFNPDGPKVCKLRDMEFNPYGVASLCGNLLCSVQRYGTKCAKWSKPKFVLADIDLNQRRNNHLCWDRGDDGVILMGGSDSKQTAERVNLDTLISEPIEEFLVYPTDQSCGVDLGRKYAVIGGKAENGRKVIIYNEDGWDRTADNLEMGRYAHACARFQNEDDKTSIIVTGGISMRNERKLATTEIMGDISWFSDKWRILRSANLPRALSNAAALTMDNQVYLFGGETNYETLDTIWMFTGKFWDKSKVSMNYTRKNHAVMVLHDVLRLCAA